MLKWNPTLHSDFHTSADYLYLLASQNRNSTIAPYIKKLAKRMRERAKRLYRNKPKCNG